MAGNPDRTGASSFVDKVRNFMSRHILLIAMGVACLFLAWHEPKFMLPDNLMNLARRMSAVTVVAVGETLVILTAGIDLSVGSVSALCLMLAGYAIKNWGCPIYVGFAIGVLTGLCCGAVNGLLVTKGRIPPFIATLGMMLAARGGALRLSGGSRIAGFGDEFKLLGGGSEAHWWIPFVVMLVIVCGFAILLQYTRSGRELYAVGGNLSAARLSGINVDWIRLCAYMTCGALAGFGGIMQASRSGVCDPTGGEGWELDAIAACVVGGASLIGGEGGAIGALLGALIIAVLVNVCQLRGMANELQRINIGVLIVTLVFLDNLRKRRSGKLKEL